VAAEVPNNSAAWIEYFYELKGKVYMYNTYNVKGSRAEVLSDGKSIFKFSKKLTFIKNLYL